MIDEGSVRAASRLAQGYAHRILEYPRELRDLYNAGGQISEWLKRLSKDPRARWVFSDALLGEERVPYKRRRPRNSYGFCELFAAMDFLEHRRPVYRVMMYYGRRNYGSHNQYDASERFDKACELLGESAPAILRKTGARPPDLLVFDSRNRLLLCEAKDLDKREELTPGQKQFFPEIENQLNQWPPPCGKVPKLPGGRWIEIVYLKRR